MKTLYSLLLLSCLLLAGCGKNNESTINNWSEDDIQEFNNICASNAEFKKINKKDEALSNEICSCLREKAIQRYSSFSEANEDAEGMKEIGDACIAEIMKKIKPEKSKQK